MTTACEALAEALSREGSVAHEMAYNVAILICETLVGDRVAMKKHRHHPKFSWKLRYVSPYSELQCHECGTTIIPSDGGFGALFGLYFIWCALCFICLCYILVDDVLSLERVAYYICMTVFLLFVYVGVGVIHTLFVRFLMPFYEKRDTSRYKIY